ncbi:MAG: alpha amylase C-terminal domain-containing protein, partial [Gemmatimonadales bacterium]
RDDHRPEGFAWIDCTDSHNSIISYVRRDGDEYVVVVLNLTPVPRDDYRIGAPVAGRYTVRLASDAIAYGGSGYATPTGFDTESMAFHGYPQSLRLNLPPLSALLLTPET